MKPKIRYKKDAEAARGAHVRSWMTWVGVWRGWLTIHLWQRQRTKQGSKIIVNSKATAQPGSSSSKRNSTIIPCLWHITNWVTRSSDSARAFWVNKQVLTPGLRRVGARITKSQTDEMFAGKHQHACGQIQ